MIYFRSYHLRELGHCFIISHFKAASLSFGIVAIIKEDISPPYIAYLII